MSGLDDLRVPLVLETCERSADGAGGWVESWHALGTLWAAISRSGVTDGLIGAGQVARVRRVITVRTTPPGRPSRPTPGQRFRQGDRLMRIRAVHEDSAEPRFLRCDVEEEATA